MFGELWQIRAVRRHFIRSSWAPVQRVKRKNHVLFAAKITELEFVSLFSRHCRKLDLRGHFSSFQSCHSFLHVIFHRGLYCKCRPCSRSHSFYQWSNNLRQGSLENSGTASGIETVVACYFGSSWVTAKRARALTRSENAGFGYLQLRTLFPRTLS